jgi:hypothetical protein
MIEPQQKDTNTERSHSVKSPVGKEEEDQGRQRIKEEGGSRGRDGSDSVRDRVVVVPDGFIVIIAAVDDWLVYGDTAKEEANRRMMDH